LIETRKKRRKEREKKREKKEGRSRDLISLIGKLTVVDLAI